MSEGRWAWCDVDVGGCRESNRHVRGGEGRGWKERERARSGDVGERCKKCVCATRISTSVDDGAIVLRGVIGVGVCACVMYDASTMITVLLLPLLIQHPS